MTRRREHIVYFKIMRGSESDVLRGLIYLEEGKQPTAEDFAQCLRDCGHQVRLVNERQFIFSAVDENGNDYVIDVLEDYRKNNWEPDPHSDQLAKTFVKQDPVL